jgi:AmmeMemoRadiSam system protein A
MLLPAERDSLIRRAHTVARRALGIRPGVPAPEPAGRLLEPGRVLVTWKRDGRPRGSAGSAEAVRPLAEEVERCAVAALVQDPRFPPSTARDYPRLTVEIAILGPLEPIHSPDAVEIGRHGLSVEKGSRRAVLLPAVPLEWRWNAVQFLEQLCLKAGLPASAWTEGRDATLYRFEADVFGDSA